MFDIIRKLFRLKKRADSDKPGRNDHCWCGSNKKYKHCHLESDQNKSENISSSDKEPLSPTHRWLLGRPDNPLSPKRISKSQQHTDTNKHPQP
ncbi:MAG: hypothetical protein HN929_12475 [Chloroflexi bacterium]|nr:hypothetical protein [Chloroflexota bacterium]MBT7082256.1 hypothetical protein [Chloroflexota bacterium]MBT7289547.1 hypothetical protein [Chloroflexota bacterium]